MGEGGECKTPIKLNKKVTYQIALELPSILETPFEKEVDERKLHEIFREIEAVYKELVDIVGGIEIPRKISKRSASSEKDILNFATTVTEFTVKEAADNVGIAENTAWSVLDRLYKRGNKLDRRRNPGSAGWLYSLNHEAGVAVLPKGKVPFPPSDEKEKMAALK